MTARSALLVALVLAGCRTSRALQLAPGRHGENAASVPAVLIRQHCGVDWPADLPPPWWAPRPEASDAREYGCPEHDARNVSYLVDAKLRTEGYRVYPTTDDHDYVELDPADRPPDQPSRNEFPRHAAGHLNAAGVVEEVSIAPTAAEPSEPHNIRAFQVHQHDFRELSVKDRVRVRDQLGVDGVVVTDVTAYKHCLALCDDLSAVVTITLYSLPDLEEIWATVCDARSTEIRLSLLVDQAAACAVKQIPHALR